MTPQEISSRLVSLCTPAGWPVTRSFLFNRPDDQAFITANILAVLDHCTIDDPALADAMSRARESMERCTEEHRAWHYPVRGGHCLMPGTPFIPLSPDADCTCLYHLTSGKNEDTRRVCEDLSHFRLDGRHFRPAKFQSGLPGIHNSFATWFPVRSGKRGARAETVDLGVDANILWYLGSRQEPAIPGAAETIRFIRDVVQSELILTAPWQVSMYYPFPPVLLYLVSRAIRWGGIDDLQDLKNRILELADRYRPHTAFDHLLLACVGKFWDNTILRDTHRDSFMESGPDRSPFYVAPLLGWLALRCPFFAGTAALPLTHIRYSAESLQLALALWLGQK